MSDHRTAAALFSDVQAADYQNHWEHPPNQHGALASASHGSRISVFINPVLAAATSGPHLWRWPVGSVIAANSYRGGGPTAVLLMRKDSNGWFWARLDASSGRVLEAGYHDPVCRDCHMAGSDNVRSFGFP